MRRPRVSGSYPGGRIVALAIVLGLWVAVACSSETPSPSSRESDGSVGGNMDIHPSTSPPEEEPEHEEGQGHEEAPPVAPTIPEGTRVPNIRGMEFEAAVTALRKLGMNFGFVIGRTNAADQWKVLEQWPGAGAKPPIGGRISMAVSMGPAGDGVAALGAVACKPEEDEIDEPYCMGKILRY